MEGAMSPGLLVRTLPTPGARRDEAGEAGEGEACSDSQVLLFHGAGQYPEASPAVAKALVGNTRKPWPPSGPACSLCPRWQCLPATMPQLGALARLTQFDWTCWHMETCPNGLSFCVVTKTVTHRPGLTQVPPTPTAPSGQVHAYKTWKVVQNNPAQGLCACRRCLINLHCLLTHPTSTY